MFSLLIKRLWRVEHDVKRLSMDQRKTCWWYLQLYLEEMIFGLQVIVNGGQGISWARRWNAIGFRNRVTQLAF